MSDKSKLDRLHEEREAALARGNTEWAAAIDREIARAEAPETRSPFSLSRQIEERAARGGRRYVDPTETYETQAYVDDEGSLDEVPNTFLVVTGRGDAESIDAYLYGANARVLTVVNADRFTCIVAVFTTGGFGAGPQSERLASGLYGAAAFDTFEAAFASVAR